MLPATRKKSSGSSAPIQFDNATTYGVNTATASFPLTVNAAGNATVYVAVQSDGGGVYSVNDPSSVVVGSVTAVKVGNYAFSGTCRISVWKAVGVPGGSQTISVSSIGSSAYSAFNAVSILNVATTSAMSVVNGTAAIVTACAVTDWVLTFFGNNGSNGAITVTAGTQRANYRQTSAAVATVSSNGATSATHNATSYGNRCAGTVVLS